MLIPPNIQYINYFERRFRFITFLHVLHVFVCPLGISMFFFVFCCSKLKSPFFFCLVGDILRIRSLGKSPLKLTTIWGCFVFSFLPTISYIMVNCWFGARWFGFLESPYERDCYLGVPDSNPKPPGPKPTINIS